MCVPSHHILFSEIWLSMGDPVLPIGTVPAFIIGKEATGLMCFSELGLEL